MYRVIIVLTRTGQDKEPMITCCDTLEEVLEYLGRALGNIVPKELVLNIVIERMDGRKDGCDSET